VEEKEEERESISQTAAHCFESPTKGREGKSFRKKRKSSSLQHSLEAKQRSRKEKGRKGKPFDSSKPNNNYRGKAQSVKVVPALIRALGASWQVKGILTASASIGSSIE